MVAFTALFGEWVLVHNHTYMLAVFLFFSVSLTILMTYLPPSPIWARMSVICVIYVLCVMTAWISPEAIPESLLIIAVVSSFTAVRMNYRWGLWFCGLAVLGQSPKIVQDWMMWNSWRHVLMYSVIGAMLILSIQLYEVSKKFHQYRKLSIYDELTNLHNVRYFRYKMNLLYHDSNVTNLCLCLIDLDKFKAVNDAFGHREGDEVLKRVAQIIELAAAPAVVSRYGGEEFAILLPNHTLTDALAIAERLRQAIEQVPLCLIPVTLSCGVSYTLKQAKTPEQLFDEADQALYRAKQMRNCVLAYHDEDGNVIQSEVAAGEATLHW